jgi:hypothetical protein
MAINLLPEELSERLWTRNRMKRGRRRLAQLRVTGEGPPYVRDGVKVLYPVDLADAWADALLGKPVVSTSEETVERVHERRRRARAVRETQATAHT